MGIFKSIDNPSSKIGGSKSALDYVGKKAELTKGINCSDDYKQAYKDFQETKELYNKIGGRQFKHFVLSFEGSTNNSEQVLELGEKVATHLFKDHEVFLAVHTDTDNYHCHMVVNSVNLMTGYKYRHSKFELENYKEVINELGKEYDFSLTKNTELVQEQTSNEIGDIYAPNTKKLNAINRHFNNKKESDIVNTYSIVLKVLSENKIKSVDEFGEKLKEQGITLDWQEQRKNVTFEIDEKYANSKKRKFRLSNLEKTFSDPRLKKESLNLYFEKNLELEIEKLKELEIKKSLEITKAKEIEKTKKIKSRERDRGGMEL